MITRRITVTSDRKPEIERFIRDLPGMLAGRVRDPHGVSAGMKARLAWAMFSLIAPAFNKKGRGGTDEAGEKWHPLSQNYLAYRRPITGRKPPKGPGKAPGGNNGFLNAQQLKMWRRIYSQALGQFIMRESDADAKAHAAAVAWIVLKEMGAKTKLEEFGKRQPGSDYQILVDTGLLRRSLMPGELVNEQQPKAEYRPKPSQAFEDRGSRLLVGTLVPYAKYHHEGKGKRRRRLWPERFPADWWRQINDAMIGGITRIGVLFGGTST